MHRRLLSPLLISLALLVLAPATALAQATLDRTGQGAVAEAAAGLQENYVYVDPDAEDILSEAEANALRDRIAESGAAPMYVAVLPEEAVSEAGGSPEQLLADIANSVRRQGTYALIAGNSFRAGATQGVLPRGEASQLADEALAASGSGGAAAILNDFTGRVAQARLGDGGARDPDGSEGVGGGLLLALIAGGVGIFALRARKRRKQQQAEVDEVREFAREDLIALGQDIRALDLDVEMPGVDPRAKEDYHHAVTMYDQADDMLERARHPEDVTPVTKALEEGRYAMESAKARLAGKEPPEHRPPCFFDPRHGPSTRDVEWAPAGGQPRPVPACEADALRVEEGQEPAAREVVIGGQRTPYWNAPAMYGPWAGGYFGGMAGGLLPGLLVGSMLGGMFSPGYAYGAGDYGGDFGGGDFGGGDFGGGDFGGGGFGDFGGGDF